MPAPPQIPFHAIRQPAFLYGSDGRVAEANDLAEALGGRPLTGCSPAAVTDIFDLRSPAGARLSAADLPDARALAGEEAIEVPLAITASDGRTVHVLANAFPLRDGSRVVGALSVWHEVTERWQADRDLAFHALLFDRMTDAVIATDTALRVTAWNSAAEELYGWSAGEAIGRLVHEVTGAVVTCAEWQESIAQFGRGEVVQRRIRQHHRDGRPLVVEGRFAPVHDLAGRLIGYVAVNRDVTQQELLLGKFAETEAKYRNLVELAPDGILIHQDGVIVFVNTMAVTLLGAAGPEDLVGRPVLEIVHPGTREDVGSNIEMDLRGEESPTTTVDLLRPDGTTVTVQGRGAMIPFDGRPAVQVVLRDVTEEKRAEEDLKDFAARLQKSEREAWARLEEIETIYDTAPIGLCVLDTELRFVRINRRLAEINGVPIEEHIGRALAEVVPDLSPQGEAALRKVLETGEPLLDLEVSGTTPAQPGRLRYWNECWAPLRDESGEIVGISIMAVEVTERKMADEALRESERRYRQLFSSMSESFALCEPILDADGRPIDYRFLDVNPANELIAGLAADDVVGRTARGLVPDPDPFWIDLVGAVALTGVPRSGEHRSSTGRWFFFTAYSPSPGRCAFLLRDITPMKETEEALAAYARDLERSNEELQRFAYVASHDLQEPLRSIVSFSQLLERRYSARLDVDADEYIGYIVDGGQRMQALIQDLLQFSRIETRPLSPVATDAGEVAADVVRSVAATCTDLDATVALNPLPMVMADPSQLEQVFANLIGNALKYHRPGVCPAIAVSAERHGDWWEFAIRDNGIGIEAEYFDRIFVIFQRLHTKDQYEGTGIGLAIVRKIVERHGGRVRVESMPGEGSTFFFTLPAV